MPRYLPNSRFSDCWGSVGEITFYYRNGVCHWKGRSRPVFPGTSSQLENADIHGRVLMAWRTLPPSVQMEWNRLAAPVISHKPPFDGKWHITGYNLFMSAYHGFAQLGDEYIPEPQQWRDFPVVYSEPHSASVDGVIC